MKKKSENKSEALTFFVNYSCKPGWLLPCIYSFLPISGLSSPAGWWFSGFFHSLLTKWSRCAFLSANCGMWWRVLLLKSSYLEVTLEVIECKIKELKVDKKFLFRAPGFLTGPADTTDKQMSERFLNIQLQTQWLTGMSHNISLKRLIKIHWAGQLSVEVCVILFYFGY